MVEVLATACGVGAGRLDVAVGRGTDPYVLPHGRNDQIAQPSPFGPVGDGTAAGIDVAEASPAADPGDARAIEGAVAQPGPLL